MTRALTILVTLAVGTLGHPGSTAAEPPTQSASGSGQFQYTDDTGATGWRTFAFEAHRSADGTASGTAVVKNRATGQAVHARIDCLNVIGNVAVMSGTATSATGPGNTDGDTEIFGVQDNGVGAGAPPDRVTRFYGNSGFVCTDVTPANVGQYTDLLHDVEAGNLTVR
jgi:hypothetical protein